MNQKKDTITEQQVALYNTTSPLLGAIYKEIQELSKKKPDGTLNTSKVKVINRLLSDIKGLLNNEPTTKYLDIIQDDDLPQYSDMVLILSQYSSALTQFKNRYYNTSSGFGVSAGWNMKS